MTTLEITDAAISERKRLLVELFRSRFPTGDWTRNSVLYDHVFGSIALNALVQDAQLVELEQLFTLDSILSIADPDTQQQALERFASNLQLSVHRGTPARGFVDVVFTTQTEGVIPSATRFYGRSVALQLDAAQGLLFTIADLSPVINASNVITGYRLRIPVVTLTAGAAANISPQRLTAYDRFAPNIAYVEVVNTFTGGSDRETAEDFAERLPDAITLRQPTTNRGLRTILRDTFPEISSTPVVIGAGAPEMVRDLTPLLGSAVRIHRGGAVDVYVDAPLTSLPVAVIVGGEQQDTSPVIQCFRDLDLDFRDVDLRGLTEAGDVLRILSPGANETSLYKIDSVEAYYLVVSALTPFRAVKPVSLHDGLVYEDVTIDPAIKKLTLPSAETRFTVENVGDYVYLTDGSVSLYARIDAVSDLNTQAFGSTLLVDDVAGDLYNMNDAQTRMFVFRDVVLYSVGDNHPNYNNKIPARKFGQITRSIRVPGSVTLGVAGVARAYSVELDDPGTLPEAAGTGVVRFPSRLTTPPPPVVTPAAQNRGYQLVNHAPLFAGSLRASTRLRVGPEDTRRGTDGALVVTPGSIRFSTSTSAFSVDDVGSRIVILRAVNGQNAGAYRISSVVSPSTVELERLRRIDGLVASVSEPSLPWRVDASGRYDGRLLRATVDAVPAIATIQTYLDADDVRPTTESILVRAAHPVYVGVGTALLEFPGTGSAQALRYAIKPGKVEAFPQAEARQYLARQFELFDRTQQELNAFDVAVWLTTQYASFIDKVLPVELTYVLLAPDGTPVYFKSADKLALEEAYLVNQLQAPALAAALEQGVSDRTIRLRSTADMIRLQRV
jgi:hypothetical protein